MSAATEPIKPPGLFVPGQLYVLPWVHKLSDISKQVFDAGGAFCSIPEMMILQRGLTNGLRQLMISQQS